VKGLTVKRGILSPCLPDEPIPLSTPPLTCSRNSSFLSEEGYRSKEPTTSCSNTEGREEEGGEYISSIARGNLPPPEAEFAHSLAETTGGRCEGGEAASMAPAK
jgi:hypothetical protein